ncbi:MAG: tetratricopeptide repeat protein [Porphyrobacter sp.]|nr:tetratricopeptide repeat protein [Porphyrobacter sp.]
MARQDFESNSPTVTVDAPVLSEGDWDACTILDPRRDLNACAAFAYPAARGANGRAAARVADGLGYAWQGNLDRAIEAFDSAIRTAPGLSVAYLNRGLAYQSKGDLRRALADLDRAIANEPSSARGYYHRSRLYRSKGDTARADKDAKRAIEIDPGYQAVLP